MKPLYVSFFTPDYAEDAAGLVATLDAFGLDHIVRPLPPKETWEANCAMKPDFIASIRAENTGRSLVWVDADARVRQYPELLDELAWRRDIDFAAHWRDGRELLSGTLFFGASHAAGELLSAWSAACRLHPDVWDQVTLSTVIAEPRFHWLNIRRLPAPYTLIFDTMAHQGPPVMEHLQASRRTRSAYV